MHRTHSCHAPTRRAIGLAMVVSSVSLARRVLGPLQRMPRAEEHNSIEMQEVADSLPASLTSPLGLLATALLLPNSSGPALGWNCVSCSSSRGGKLGFAARTPLATPARHPLVESQVTARDARRRAREARDTEEPTDDEKKRIKGRHYKKDKKMEKYYEKRQIINHKKAHNAEWFAKRMAKEPAAMRPGKKKRNAKWEAEGDWLFEELSLTDADLKFGNLPIEERVKHAESLLAPLSAMSNMDPDNPDQPAALRIDPSKSPFAPENVEKNVQETAVGKRTMWGACSVGPIFLPRLKAAGLETPFHIQEKAFKPISQGKNVVIGSATGSGKTLAFILPILCRSQRSIPHQIIVVTASKELTQQLRREVDRLWPPEPNDQGEFESAVHIVGSGDPSLLHEERVYGAEYQEIELGRHELDRLTTAPIIAGTPSDVKRLIDATNNILRKPVKKFGGIRGTALEFKENLKTVVLDEADLLLESEQAARIELIRRQVKDAQNKTLTKAQRVKLKKQLEPSETYKMMTVMPKKWSEMQLVCASATVGRELRRQLMGVLEAPSIEKAAMLVGPDGRNSKNVETRQAIMMPQTLMHRYRLVTKRIKTSKDPEKLGKKNTDSRIDQDEGIDGHSSLMATLQDTMDLLEPGPAIIFDGRAGSKRVVEGLAAAGCQNVSLLKDLGKNDDEQTETEIRKAQWQTEEAVIPSWSIKLPAWENTPIYVGAEKWARGIDIDVDYVFLLYPPGSSATYAHLAGRTGRRGRDGTAITLVTPAQSPRIVGYADHLGLRFMPI